MSELKNKTFLLSVLLLAVITFVVPNKRGGLLYAQDQGHDGIGIMVLGHGDSTPGWAEEIIEVVRGADLDYPAEVAFLEMVPEHTVDGAIERLEDIGVDTIIVIPLLVSTHHSHGFEIEYELGLREGPSSSIIKPIQTECDIILTPGMNGHQLIGELLLERALGLSDNNDSDPGQEVVVLLVHGADLGWKEFQADMDMWTDYINTYGGFKDVRYGVLSPTFNMPTVVRDAQRLAKREGGEVILIPLVLSEGMYSNMLFPVLSLIGVDNPAIAAIPLRATSLVASSILPLIPEVIMDPALMIGMKIADKMMEMMMGGGDGDMMGGMSDKLRNILLKRFERKNIQYTTEGLITHPNVSDWIKEMVDDALDKL